MALRLDQVVPFGRSFDEYRRMFALHSDDLQLRILGCADGPAAFNAEMTRRGQTVLSCDPLYAFSADQIRERIDVVFDDVLQQVRDNVDLFVWDTIPDPEALAATRRAAMETFLADYPAGCAGGRYLTGELPHLPLPDDAFDLALCSHFLFLYSDQFDYEFHHAALEELLRVAAEVRVFPLLDLGARRSTHVEPLIDELTDRGRRCRIDRVPYEFQRGGCEMLRIHR